MASRMAAAARPELVIGVDFGMSQTGVAYCKAPWTNPTTFQNWSNITYEIFNKTPSRIAYLRGTQQIHSWGYDVDLNDDSLDIKEYFKLHLDPDYQEFEDIHHEDAKRYFRDFLSCVHGRLVRFFQSRFPQWTNMHVEWNFSVPTTWKNAGHIRLLESIMADAGFGTDGRNHSCCVTLTEAEAAAVYAGQQDFQRNDVILVCDAGGGTTDVNVMKVKSAPEEPLKLEQLRQVEGRPIGSALIDIQIQQQLAARLSLVQDQLAAPATEIAERMMLGKFERFKCSFGSPAMTVPKLFLNVPGLPPGIDLPRAGIRDSQIELSQAVIRPIFEEQAVGLIELIEEQLKGLQRSRPGEQVSYLILSGGLASSEYIQSRLRAKFAGHVGSDLQNVRTMRLILAESMQLAVVQGIVRYRAQQIGLQVTPITQRCAPVSYGVLVSQKYNPKLHLGERVVEDPLDKKRWAINQIEWLIRKGDVVTDDGVKKQFRAKLTAASKRKPWVTHLVLSNEPVEYLPRSMAEKASVRTLSIVKVNIQRLERVLRNQHWWNFGERYEMGKLDLELIPDYANLKIRLVSGGRRLNREEDQVEIDWGASARPASEVSSEDIYQFQAYQK